MPYMCAPLGSLADMTRLSAKSLLLLFLLHFSLQSPWSHGLQPGEPEARKIYIVYLGERRHEDPELVTESHHDMLASVLGSKEDALSSIVYSYKHGFSGFAARMTESQARKIRGMPGVVSVRENQIRRVHTTRSWDFLGLDYKQPNGLLAKSSFGDGIIIGVLDSGITPESPSFSDAGYGPPPSKWKGICQAGPSFPASSCNRKLIGARWYADDLDNETLAQEVLSPRDIQGHGTHTSSTAGGNIVHNVSFRGLVAGTVRGGAPRARVAMYKVCWKAPQGGTSCTQAAQMKAMDDAIHDGVDVLSLSIGGPFEDPAEMYVVAHGIPVVYSAGNDGPIAQTVKNSSPWLLTVAATTIDRAFPVVVTLGNKETFVAQSFSSKDSGDDQFYEIQSYQNEDCNYSHINETMKAGNIIFCFTSDFSSPPDFDSISYMVAMKGGRGTILPYYHDGGLLLERNIFKNAPWVPIDYEMSYKIYQYISGIEHGKPMAKISATRTTIGSAVSAPKVAVWSSRGPSPSYPGILKPDIAAPGVSILAAAPKTSSFAKDTLYHFDSGTSMACPHVAGVVAVLKSLHPEWSPAALKSAIMTTAHTYDNNGFPIQADGKTSKLADPFDYGAGSINPNMAADPGLIYNISASEYLKFFKCMGTGGLGAHGNCSVGKSPYVVADLNLPSIAIPDLKVTSRQTVVRTVTNVGRQQNAVYRAFFQAPAGVKMAVEPSVLAFSRGRSVLSFRVTFEATRKVQGDYMFGSLAWHDGGSHWVRIPIAVRTVIEEFYSNIY